MNKSNDIEKDKEKPNIELLNDLFNHIRNQLDFLCESAKYQNAILKELYEKAYDSRN